MKRYVLVGCGTRGIFSYCVPLVQQYGDCAELCGVYDRNQKRAALASHYAGKEIPVFTDFNTMLDTVKPDAVIITTKDCDHDYYAIRAMKSGCNVISEKPLTTTFEKSLEIKRTQAETGKDVRVTFNLRFQPFFQKIKELLAQGIIGDILSVHFEWMLDTVHGASYFRRWHRERKNSGSLLVHKSTHHFDLVNWFLEQDPVSVNAFGSRNIYGPTRTQRSERCLTCPYKNSCEFFFDIQTGIHKDIYLNCEDEDGYYRDKCVFSEEIDIEDTVSVSVAYSGGTVMSYSLTAHSPYEGINLVFNGSSGRMEIKRIFSEGVSFSLDTKDSVKVYDHSGRETIIRIECEDTEGHGGADTALRNAIFRGMETDPLKQNADLRNGMMSIGIGMAANISMAENRRVYLDEYYKGI